MVTIRAIGEGERVTVDLDGTPVTVFNLGERYVAYVDRCLHQSGPVCSRGTLHPHLDAVLDERGEAREFFVEGSQVIACPWHGWEYDLETGEALWNRSRRLRPARVEVDGDAVTVSL
ncbi:Rieske 2Fe-2S domain-containing protein [Solirubrobacter sp. CPCC 204708]|uniref:Rieske 2Fe-2S domain-containing protein n=1 Tax=Solirubrobacter deserti TaxID=2282478 RepID=A0ABT4RFA9_9ACTN|nr:Rieske 2Fe-2S domain-containing protein [Solirubrobacter deserti]MBE2319485.1 Rieske 2Fe-2S domain-containing protein [Solirubrobacter deserti]MDA0137228.1 Rieske 2Fe-2S domain-containing protein [Solirubrobacter deserti]